VNLPKGSKLMVAGGSFGRRIVSNTRQRLVVKGYSQKEGIEYNECFSPIGKHTSIRLLLVIVAPGDFELE